MILTENYSFKIIMLRCFVVSVPGLMVLYLLSAVCPMQARLMHFNSAIVHIRLRPQSGAAPWWVSLSIRHGVKSMLLPIEALFLRLFRHPYNRKYITYRNPARGRPRHGHG